jgi:pimeloyl-ACP methyl ester carboxylesterase
MPAVLVHGVPDTEGMWDRLREHLARDDVIALALPGFAAPVPDGFGATKEEYAAWVADQLAAFGEPVDLVGHDWGGMLVQRVASQHPDRIRSLACGSGPVDRTYTWHAMAQAWQTPETGEQIMEGMLAMPTADLAAGFAAGGAPEELAARQARWVDETMARCILALYRSALTPGDDWEDEIAAMPRRPSLVLWGADDPYCGPEIGTRIAARLDADLVVFDGCNHWWPHERAAESAAALEELWARAD